MSKKNKGGSNLGRTLIKDRFGHTPRRKVDNDTMVNMETVFGFEPSISQCSLPKSLVTYHRNTGWL